ncbi:SufD family Fe-S cluster assembly protein [Candidatus Micrarchaeota archaeon]|nr:SufD family Fe-S cluster assembly protein [Candidatus Micrarchaeota archaeon]
MSNFTDIKNIDSGQRNTLKNAFSIEPAGKILAIAGNGQVQIPEEDGTFYIYAKENSESTVVEKSTSIKTNKKIFIYLAKGAKLTYTALQEVKESGTERKAVCEDNSEIKWYIANISEGKSDENRETKLLGYGSKVNDMELFFINDAQEIKNKNRVFHIGKGTYSRVLVKGLLKDTATAVYDGLVKIEKNASGSDSFLGQHTLMLNPGAKADTTPGLEIENSEVKAGHAASSTKINEEEIFYLRAKGIPEADAKKLIALGFLYEVIEKMPGDKQEFYNAIEEKWAVSYSKPKLK